MRLESQKYLSVLFFSSHEQKRYQQFFSMPIICDFLCVSRPEVAEQSGDLPQMAPGPLFPR